MLKKMRRRFIVSAMAAFCAVILLLLCVVNVWNYHNVAAQQDRTLSQLATAEARPENPSETADHGEPPEKKDAAPLDDHGAFSPEVPYTFRYFSVSYDADGTLSSIGQDFIASISSDDALTFADHVLSTGRANGYYQGYRYLVQRTSDGTKIVFLNCEREMAAVRSLLWITVSIAAASLALVFALVVVFSRRAIAPYLRNLEMQKQFITNASHELKTPLTAISTSADVLLMEHEDDEWAKSIAAQCAKLSRLIGDLVTLSRLDEENPFPEKVPFDLSDALWEAAEPFAAVAKGQNKTYSQSIAEPLTITGDAASIRQMAGILLDNAVKYTPPGGSIAFSAARSGRKIKLCVENTCDDAQTVDPARMFERFYRGDESHGGKIGGSGVGLSIARATAEAHGGSIRAEQKNGRMTITVALPA